MTPLTQADRSVIAPAPCEQVGTDTDIRLTILRALLAGSDHAAAAMPWRTFGPIRLPDDDARLAALRRAHLRGEAATIEFAPLDKPTRAVQVDALQLAAYTPRPNGTCTWIAFDFDGASHGARGLTAPERAAAALAERAAAAGLLDGILVVRSRSGAGLHVWLLLPEPVPLADACIIAAGLGAQAGRIADRDVQDYGCAHALATASGIASVGQAGAFELLPRSSERPRRGYPLVLPFSGMAAQRGGGVAVDPFGNPPKPIEPQRVPRCDVTALHRFIDETRTELRRRQPRRRTHRPAYEARGRKLDPRTSALIEGRTPQGERNRAVYYALPDLVRSGVREAEAEALIVAGAERCGLSRAEIDATLRSARRRLGVHR